MELYAIFRRNLAAPEGLAAVDQRSQAELDRRTDQVRKIRSFVFEEDDGTLGTICVYEAESPQAIRDHGRAADVPVDDIRRVTTIDVHRPDPERVTVGGHAG